MHREQEAKTGRKLVVYFPGIGYHCDKPLLYYSRRLAAVSYTHLDVYKRQEDSV